MFPSDTFFTRAPHWEWLVVVYFFLGGLSAGSFFLSALVDLFGRESDRPLARLGYVTSLAMLLPAAPLLILDLNRPERFWHMLFQANRFPLPMFKWWSPMSAGAWGLTLFGGFAFLMAVGALAQMGYLPSPLRALRSGPLRPILAGVGALFAFYIASYTGVLLSVTNRPLWADTSLLGMLFVVSAASTSAALLVLLGRARREVDPASVHWLMQVDSWALMLELVVLVAVVISLGAVAQAWLNFWGVLLVAVAVGGILLPLFLHWRPTTLGRLSTPIEAMLVLAGGFVLRSVIVLSSGAIEGATAWLQH